jgi:signal transduction histidine kinase
VADVRLFQRDAASGSLRAYRAGANPLRLPTGQVRGAVLSFREIASDAGHAAPSTETDVASAGEIEQSEFLGKELPATLRAIDASLRRALGNDTDDVDRRDAVEEAGVLVDVLTRASADVRDLSAERGSLRPKRSPVPLAPLLRTASELVYSLVQSSSQYVVWTCEPMDLVADVDGELVARLVRNLIEHCSRASPAATRIDVSARALVDGVSIAVRDEGPPPAEPLSAERFWASGAPEATGDPDVRAPDRLLRAARLFAHAHGGDLSVEGATPRGARFLVTLPRTHETP